MRVLGLVGSPRKGGNTDLLVSRILDGATASNHLTEKVYLYALDISPCVDCRSCQKGKFQCAIDDDMQRLYPKLESAGVIVFGTPLYIVVVPSEEGADACGYLVGMFELSFEYLGIVLADKMLVKAYEKAEVKEQPETLNRAFELGKALK